MKKSVKQTYKVRNWSEYEQALKTRGSLTFSMSEDVIEDWKNQEKTGRRGASKTYTDTAIATMATIKLLFGLAGRQTEGFLHSLFELMDLELPIPDHTTLSRRDSQLKVELPLKPNSEARHIVVDATGVKVYGEGEWKVRQHGWSKRRTWRKLHLGVDEATGEIVAAVCTTNDIQDVEVFEDVLDSIEGEISLIMCGWSL